MTLLNLIKAFQSATLRQRYQIHLLLEHVLIVLNYGNTSLDLLFAIIYLNID